MPLIDANQSLRLHDLGDGVAWLEPVAASLDGALVDGLEQAMMVAEDRFAALIVGPRAGAFLATPPVDPWLPAINLAAWGEITEAAERAQSAFAALADLAIPVLGLLTGPARLGGAELLLHCREILASNQADIALDSLSLGLIPCHGGCARLLCLNALPDGTVADATAGALFDIIAGATPVTNADGRAKLGLKITGLPAEAADPLVAAKHQALAMARGDAHAMPAVAPEHRILRMPGAPLLNRLIEKIDVALFQGDGDPSLQAVLTELAVILSGGDIAAGAPVAETELRRMEREILDFLIRRPATRVRLEARRAGKGRKA